MEGQKDRRVVDCVSGEEEGQAVDYVIEEVEGQKDRRVVDYVIGEGG